MMVSERIQFRHIVILGFLVLILCSCALVLSGFVTFDPEDPWATATPTPPIKNPPTPAAWIIPPEQCLFVELNATARGRRIVGERNILYIDAPTYRFSGGHLSSAEKVRTDEAVKILVGRSRSLYGAAGEGTSQDVQAYDALPVDASVGGTHMPFTLRAYLHTVEADGTLQAIVNGKEITLPPGGRHELGRARLVITTHSVILYSGEFSLVNHGLLDKGQIASPAE